MFGKRSDGVLVKDLDPIIALTPYLMPQRNDAMVMTDYDLDFSLLTRYIAKKSAEGIKITFLELVIAAYVRMVAEVPQLNRFVANKRIYARKYLAVSFAILQPLANGGVNENTTKVYFDPTDTLYDVSARLQKAIGECRKEDADNLTMVLARILTKPILANPIVALVRLLDRYGLMPKIIHEASPFHTSLFITNNASIGLPRVYHHIYNFGTCSQFFGLGNQIRSLDLDREGKPVRKRTLPVGAVIDERVAEGYVYSKMTGLMSKYLSHPELLEVPPEKVVWDQGYEYHVPKVTEEKKA